LFTFEGATSSKTNFTITLKSIRNCTHQIQHFSVIIAQLSDTTKLAQVNTQLLNMAPTRSKKQRKSTESASSGDIQQQQIVATKTRSPTRTPSDRSPIKKMRMGITVGQKQALIDNLQLESKCLNKQQCSH
jgi:hypothetical protein